jgi:hypothetical protein
VPLFHWLAERVTFSQGIIHSLSCDGQGHTGRTPRPGQPDPGYPGTAEG